MDCGIFSMNGILFKRAKIKRRKGAMAVPYQELSTFNFKDDNNQYDQADIHNQEGEEEEEEDEEIRFSRPSRDSQAHAHVTVVVGKERRVFKVDPQIMADELFQSLLEKAKAKAMARDSFGGIVILEHCDSILFEHMLWLMCNDDPSLLRLNLEDLIEFYAQDGD